MMTLTLAPTEILIYILSELEGKDLSSVSQTCHHLNSICKIDSLWERLCKHVDTHAPFPSWHDLYVTTLHKWGWLAGIWCGDSRFVGKSPWITELKSGHMMEKWISTHLPALDPAADNKLLRAQLKLSHAIHSIHPNVTVSTFTHKVRPDRRPTFSVPRTFDDGPQNSDETIATTDDSMFIRRWEMEAGRRLSEYPEDEWPGHLSHSTSAPGIARIVLVREQGSSQQPIDSLLFGIAHSAEALDLFRAGYFPRHRGDVTMEQLGKISRRLLEPSVGAPYQGLWVGEYSSHGPEFLMFLQRIPNRLEVLKITGDHNVPLAEYTWVVPDLTRIRRTCTEQEFQGLRATSGSGQIAGTFFASSRWVDIEVYPRSYDNVSVLWPALRHVSEYKRVNVAEMLDPDYYGTWIRDP